MHFRAVVLVGCFSLAMLGAASGAGAQSALPNGYTLPGAFSNGWDAPSIVLGRWTDGESSCEGNPVGSIDPSTGAVTCVLTELGCYLGSLKVEVVVGGKRASFTGRKDCALYPKGCLKADGSHDPRNDCSNAGKAQTAAIYVKGCWEREVEVAGYCVGIRHTAAVAKRRHVSTVASWKVSFNGKRIGSGRMRLTTTFTPAVRGKPGKRIYSDTNFDSFYNYCLDDPWPRTYSSQGRIYCWYPGTSGRKAKWTDKALYLSGST